MHQQLGGGKLLTAGAAYYSDTHPNSFSILCIPDTIKDVVINPFVYQNGWRNYDMENREIIIEKVQDLPSVGDMKEGCTFVIETQTKKYEIPLKKVSVYQYEKDGVPYIKADNRKEVLRYLDVKCEGSLVGGKTDVSVELAPKMQHSIRAMLKRDEYFNFLAQNSSKDNDIKFYIISDSGIKFITGSCLDIDIAEDDGVYYLRKIKKIEDYYEVRFYRPDDLYERDAERIDLLTELIDKGYTEKLKLGTVVSTSFKDYEKLKLFYEQALKKNAFSLIYDDDFMCDFFDAKINIGTVRLVAGIYQVDLEDVKRKVDTFIQGDSRQITFTAMDDFQTYFVTDKEKAGNQILLESESIIFGVGKMELKWGFIYNSK